MLRIVVIDDEIRTRRGISNLLAKTGENYQVVGEAADGMEGYDVITQQKPDLVITDIRMPNLDGLEMIEKLKVGGLKCKYIILSSYAEFDYAKKAVKLGIAEYLLKPVTVNELVTCIQTVEKEIFNERLSSDFMALNAVSPEIILERLIINRDDKTEAYISELENHIGIGCNNYYGLVVIDFEKVVKDSEKMSFLDTLNDLVSREGKGKIQHIVTRLDYKNQLLILFVEAEKGYSGRILHGLKNSFDTTWWLTSFIIGYMEIEDLHSIAETYACLCESFQWRIVMKEGDILDPVKLKSIKCSKFNYPMEIEERICNLMKVLDFDQIIENIELFFDKLNGEIYHPSDVKEGVIRFTNSMLFLIRQVNVEIYDNIKQMEIIEWLRNCRHQDKMKNVVINLVNQIFIYSSKKQTIGYGLVVQKAISIIREEYASDL